jgi:hypothetical protein
MYIIFFPLLNEKKMPQYGCFESCKFRPCSVFFVSWRLKLLGRRLPVIKFLRQIKKMFLEYACKCDDFNIIRFSDVTLLFEQWIIFKNLQFILLFLNMWTLTFYCFRLKLVSSEHKLCQIWNTCIVSCIYWSIAFLSKLLIFFLTKLIIKSYIY